MPRKAGDKEVARRLGERIRALREEAKITQEKLAWEIEIDKGYLSQVEAGKRTPSLPVLCALAERLGIEVADLVGYDLTNDRLRLLDAARRGDREEVLKALRRLKLL